MPAISSNPSASAYSYLTMPGPGAWLNRKHRLAYGLVGCWLLRDGDRVPDLSGVRARGVYAQSTQGTWDPMLRPSKLFRIAQTADGVLDSEIVLPTENVEATDDPLLGEVGLITPELVLVRRRQ